MSATDTLIRVRTQSAVVRALTGSTAVVAALMLSFERRMHAGGGPGIIPFELAGSPEKAAQIMARWGPRGLRAARQSLVADQLFLATYSAVLATGAEQTGDLLRERDHPRLAKLAPIVATAAVAAGVCDLAENLTLLAVTAGRSQGGLPRLARRFARTKFGLLAVVLPYSALGIKESFRRRYN